MKYKPDHYVPDFGGFFFAVFLIAVLGVLVVLCMGDQFHDWFCCVH